MLKNSLVGFDTVGLGAKNLKGKSIKLKIVNVLTSERACHAESLPRKLSQQETMIWIGVGSNKRGETQAMLIVFL
jgi:hypothetical protein